MNLLLLAILHSTEQNLFLLCFSKAHEARDAVTVFFKTVISHLEIIYEK